MCYLTERQISDKKLRPVRRPSTYRQGDLVGRSAGLGGAGNLSPTGIQSPDRPARSESVRCPSPQ